LQQRTAHNMKKTIVGCLAIVVLASGCANEPPTPVTTGVRPRDLDSEEAKLTAPPAAKDDLPVVTVAHSLGGREEVVMMTPRNNTFCMQTRRRLLLGPVYGHVSVARPGERQATVVSHRL